MEYALWKLLDINIVHDFDYFVSRVARDSYWYFGKENWFNLLILIMTLPAMKIRKLSSRQLQTLLDRTLVQLYTN